MPELAEVEFFRRRWNPGAGTLIVRVQLHAAKRVFRGTDTDALEAALTGARFTTSEAHGKQMLFRFSSSASLGIHLGMTGELRVEPPEFAPQKHDHLALFQRERALVFSDPRLFGRVLFSREDTPPWWRDLPPQVLSTGFTPGLLGQRLARRRTQPLKATLLDQSLFPGIGNWMADEILWQMRTHPCVSAGSLNDRQMHMLWRATRHVARRAIETVASDTMCRDFGDPPKQFLFHARWTRNGKCPRDGETLRREPIGGRTTVWCPQCQPPPAEH